MLDMADTMVLPGPDGRTQNGPSWHPNPLRIRRPARLGTRSQSELCGGLAVRQLPARPWEVAGVAARVTLEVVLVFGLGLPERDGLADVGHHLARPQARGVDVSDRVL